MPRDYYEILGVPRTAGDAELKKAYRQLAMQYHPDRNPGDKQAEDRFKEASEAYAVLSDPDKRAQYDRFGTVAGLGGVDFGQGFGTLFEDIFESFFAGGGRGRRSRAGRGEDLQYELKITLEDSARGLETKVQIPRLEVCEACAGTGAEAGSQPVTCDVCHGRGEVRLSQGFLTVARTCPKCRGEGELNRKPCPQCRGEGRVRAERVLQIKIPAGIEDGMQMRISGEGSSGHQGGPAGDLYVLVRIAEHDLFARKNADLYCELPVTFAQLALGAELDVPVLDGTAKLKVPAGSQPHQLLKIRGKGMPRLRERGHGDSCYRLVLEVPQKLNAKQREALEAFDAASKGHGTPLISAFLERMKKLLD
ncbi:MAG: molecular chaperone DnaJ [Candidatus Rokubacteria bacterium 13_1_40CM_68_15]|nr:MAG: molecular chaperone DnaJ [Candidatus Rokubacteria bacterium 13_1_40CM_68_15]